MKTIFHKLADRFNLNLEAPFTIEISGQSYTFQCLIKGYGAEKGMVIDKNWSKIETVKDKLIESGYGFSCFEIDESSLSESFHETLNEWEKIPV